MTEAKFNMFGQDFVSCITSTLQMLRADAAPPADRTGASSAPKSRASTGAADAAGNDWDHDEWKDEESWPDAGWADDGDDWNGPGPGAAGDPSARPVGGSVGRGGPGRAHAGAGTANDDGDDDVDITNHVVPANKPNISVYFKKPTTSASPTPARPAGAGGLAKFAAGTGR